MSIYKTKTFWGGIVTIVSGIGVVVTGDIAAGLQLVATGFAAIFLRSGIQKTEVSQASRANPPE